MFEWRDTLKRISSIGVGPPGGSAPDKGQPPTQNLQQQELAEIIRQALDGLNERQRVAIVLNKFEDMNYADIAEVMGLSTKAVKSLLSRARTKLREAKSREADASVRDLVLQQLIDRVDVELPESLVDEETEHRVQSAKNRADRAGVSLEDALAAQGWDELRFRSDARAHAVRAIKADLVLEAVARAEGLEVTAEELAEEIGQLAVALGRDAKELAKTLDRTGQVVALAGDIIRSKALDILVERADITQESPEDAAKPAEPADGMEEQA